MRHILTTNYKTFTMVRRFAEQNLEPWQKTRIQAKHLKMRVEIEVE
jgi:hypothetical protein